MQVTLWSICAGSLVLAGLSNWAERRRAGRQNLDDVGFMPWPLVMVLAMLVSAIAAAFALHAR